MHRKMVRLIPVTLVTGIIFFLSNQEGADLPLPALPGLDKVLHIGVYAVLAASAIYAFPPEIRSRRPVRVALLAGGYCLLFGLSDEYHQSFIADRYPSGWDLAADLTGILITICCWRLLGTGKHPFRRSS